MCPISTRRLKDDIRYVAKDELQALHDDTLSIRLATYNYKPEAADPSLRHLGFIIEDRPRGSAAVDWSHDRADLYGYLSMVVATVKVQEEEIQSLKRELDEARRASCPVAVGPSQPR